MNILLLGVVVLCLLSPFGLIEIWIRYSTHKKLKQQGLR